MVLSCTILLLSCSGSEETSSNGQISIKPIDQNGLKQLVNNRHGKTLLLNVWATWCIPCREEFPDLVKLSEKYKDKNLEIVGISADYFDEVDSKIVPFLKSQKTNFKNYVQNFSDDSALINLLNPDWNGALPASFIYDESGKLISFLEGKHTFEEFEQILKRIEN